MGKLLSQFVNKLGKHDNFKFDEQLATIDKLKLFGQMGCWSLRGLVLRFRVKSIRGLVLIGPRVRIRYGNHLNAGKNLIIEEGAEVMALSLDGIKLGNNVTIGANSTIKPTSYYGKNLGVGLKIGNNSNIGRYSYIGCSGGIEIGNNVMLSPRVGMYAENHNFERTDIPIRDQGVTRSKIVIEDDCWLASNTIILAGVTIGRGSIIAAGSVINADIPPYSVVAGVPGKILLNRKK